MKSHLRLLRLHVVSAGLCIFLAGCGGTGGGTSPTVPMPTIESISPNTIPADPSGPVQIVITGTGFVTTSQVQGNSVTLTATYVSATELEALIPVSMSVPGATLTITVSNGSVSSASTPASAVNITNPLPSILSLAPSTALAGSGQQTITLTGSGFVPATSVTVNSAARTTTYTSPTQIEVVLTAADLATAGTLSLVATNAAPGGGVSGAVSFAISNPMPTETSISPATIGEGSAALTLDVKGTSFATGSTVFWNQTALVTTVVSATELNAIVPATLLSAAASVSVAVVNPAPGGGQSSATIFAVTSPAPTLTAINPSAVAVNQAAIITLIGSGFALDSVGQWNGSARSTTFTSASSLAVSLSAADLSAVGTANLSVSNPAPGGGVTKALSLTITNQAIPTITGVTISLPSPGTGACPLIQVHAVGTNLSSTHAVVNGVSLQNSYSSSTDVYGGLPLGFSSAPGNFSVVATQTYGQQLSSEAYVLSATAAPLLSICATPAGATILPASKFLLNFVASQVNSSAVPTVNAIALPAGITTSASFPIAIPAGAQGSARQVFNAASTLAPGALSVPFTGSAGSTSTTGTISLTVSSAPASVYFSSFPFSELGVPIGGSNSISFTSSGQGQDYSIDLAVSGLPTGTTATVSPSTIIPGDSFTVTISAASTAPESQNVPVTATGTPSVAGVTSPKGSFTLDVTPAPGSLPNNRSDFVSTEATPSGMAYDRQLDLIFVSNSVWNRVDIISNKTRLLQQSIPVRGIQTVDVSQDGSTVWIGTDSQQVFALNTTTFALTRYLLPQISGASWQDNILLALSDGTLLLGTSHTAGEGGNNNAIWAPSTNQITVLPGSSYLSIRSGDGSKVYGINYASGYTTTVYNVATKTVSTLPLLGQGYELVAVNSDGSLLVGSDNNLYNGSAQLIGALPGNVGNNYIDQFSSIVFSPDGSTLYEIGGDARIATIDVASLTLKGLAPALSTLPNGVSETPVTTSGAAVDNTGVLIGLQTYGIGFDDSTYFQNYGSSTANIGPPVLLSPNAGPLAGGTASAPYGSYDLIPDIWYGANRGSASLAGPGLLTITSPAGSADGPVNLKYIYPDGQQVFTPQAFSYSSFPQHSILSGATPAGGVPGRISGYGMPADGSGGSLMIGGQPATITTTVGQYPPYTGEAFPSTYLDYTIPAGAPGFANLSINTPIGSGSLPNAVFYAKSVNDYSSADTFTDVLYDAGRQQVYLSGTDHIDVFSLATDTWLTPLQPAILGSASQFRGLALSPDGTELLATNLLDNSLGVINPDTPSQTYAIAIPPALSGGAGCGTGPFSVSALAGNMAFVSSGLPPGIGGCPYYQTLYTVNLQTRSVARQTASPPSGCAGAASIGEASADGTLAIVGGEEGGECLYSTVSNTFVAGQSGAINYYGVAISGDGNIASVSNAFLDASGNMLGGVARPVVLFPNQTTILYPLNNYPANTLGRPRLNASGSLYYWAYPNDFEIFDVPTATLKMRFSLAEVVQNVETPLAIDAGGRQVFLITDKGLTVVDLGAAPLSIGHLSSTSGAAATQIQVRGSGFVTGLSVNVGGQSATANFVDENTFTFTVPTLTTGPHDLTVTNPNGISYTLASAIIAP